MAEVVAARVGLPRPQRERVAWDLAAGAGGVVLRRHLLDAGLTKADIATELRAGRLVRVGTHTLAVPTTALSLLTSQDAEWSVIPTARLWWAVWESGTNAVLDGAAALVATGLTGFASRHIDVSVPAGGRIHRLPGVRVSRRRDVRPAARAGVPRTEPEVAAIRAAQLTVSDRQAALVLCLVVQQRLVDPDRLLVTWQRVQKSPRRALLDPVLRDVCDGAQSLGELDFAAMCRRRRLPEPTRQRVLTGPRGRFYLDVEFACGLVVEIDGIQHAHGLAPVDDALRANHLTLTSRRVLRIPVLGLRLAEDAFMDQVARGLAA